MPPIHIRARAGGLRPQEMTPSARPSPGSLAEIALAWTLLGQGGLARQLGSGAWVKALLGTRNKGQGSSDVPLHPPGSLANAAPGSWILRLSRPPGDFFSARRRDLGHSEQQGCCSPGTIEETGWEIKALSTILEGSEAQAG